MQLHIETLEHAPVFDESGFDPASVAEVDAALASIFEAARQDESENVFQTVARKTGNIVTPGNALTLVGAVLVIDGSRHIDEVRGGIEIAAGRSFDLIDGIGSRLTGTASPLGEMVDATSDKVVSAAILWEGGKHSMLRPEKVGFIAIQNTINAIATLAAKARGREIHPSRSGKHAAAASSATISAELVSRHIQEAKGKSTKTSKTLDVLDDMAFGVNVQLGVTSSIAYLKDAFGREEQSQVVVLNPEQLADLFIEYSSTHARTQDTETSFTVKTVLGKDVSLDPYTVAELAKSYNNDIEQRTGTIDTEKATVPATVSLNGKHPHPELAYPYSKAIGISAGALAVGADIARRRVQNNSLATPLLERARNMSAGVAVYHIGGLALQDRVDVIKTKLQKK